MVLIFSSGGFISSFKVLSYFSQSLDQESSLFFDYLSPMELRIKKKFWISELICELI